MRRRRAHEQKFNEFHSKMERDKETRRKKKKHDIREGGRGEKRTSKKKRHENEDSFKRGKGLEMI